MDVLQHERSAPFRVMLGMVLLILIWTLLGSAAYTRHVVFVQGASGFSLPEFIDWLSSFYPWVLLSPLVFRLHRRYPLQGTSALQSFGRLLVLSLPVTWFGGKLALTLGALLHSLLRQPPNSRVAWWSVPLCDFILQQTLYWITVAAASVVRLLGARQDAERKLVQTALEKAEAESSLKEAELETMRMRLNPHFLFNSLQNISSLAHRDPDTAATMLARLGDLLRSATGKDVGQESPLKTEIALTRAYTAIEQMRFCDRLSVQFHVEPGLERALVPTFILQPLVENAIKHGLAGGTQSGVIQIHGARLDGQLALTVTDSGLGFPSNNAIETGVGLGTTMGRLERLYGQEHSFSIRRMGERGTEVRVVIPFREGTPRKGATSWASCVS